MDETYGGSFGLGINNFDPSNISADEVIGITFVIDKSGSVNRYISALNDNLNAFLQEMAGSHVADKILCQIIEFDDNVNVLSGFQPIADIKPFNIQPGGMTACFDANVKALENTIRYRTNLEQQGITVKNLVFIITDGESNAGRNTADDVKKLVDDLYTNESNFGSFSIVLFGLGDEANFRNVGREMGVRDEMIATIGITAKEIRKMIGFISSSVSSSGSGGGMPTSVVF